MATLNPIYIDGCFVGHWESDRRTVEAMKAGGVTAANCNRITWEDFVETMTLIAQYKQWMDDNSDILRPVKVVDDIVAASHEGRVGVILGFQNASPLNDRLYYLRLFTELGLRVLQLTYSTATSVGGGCWESRDLGLTDFGFDLVAEANRLGVLIDLSHCSPATCMDAIGASVRPVAFTHVCPAGLQPHHRNRSDEEIRAVSERGGVIGVTFERSYLRAGLNSTVDDYLEAIEYVISIAGEEHVAIGTDYTIGIADTVEYIARDKGYGRYYIEGWNSAAYIESTTAVNPAPKGIGELSSQKWDLLRAMEKRGWNGERIERTLGLNWLALFREVWGFG
jgi:membrane dipeptidase